jgi:hypothetical protein
MGCTACLAVCRDTSGPVFTRCGVCSLIHAVKLHALMEHGGSSTCSQNPSNSALFLFIFVFVSSHLVQQFFRYPACYAVRMPLPCSQEQVAGFCTEAGFNNSFPWSLMYFMSTVFFSIKIFYVFVMSCVQHVVPIGAPVICSLSPYSCRKASR